MDEAKWVEELLSALSDKQRYAGISTTHQKELTFAITSALQQKAAAMQTVTRLLGPIVTVKMVEFFIKTDQELLASMMKELHKYRKEAGVQIQ
jgi:hypothetical protein